MIKWYIAMALISYLIGSISFSVIFTKRFAGFDVRERGSKNAGSTNVLRTAGPVPAILTLVCDLLKGVGAVLLGLLFNLYSTQIIILVFFSLFLHRQNKNHQNHTT